MGLAHQFTMRLNNSLAAMAARPATPSLAASQRVRVTPWVQARRKLPVSNSRAISGAPQNIPIRAGTARAVRDRAPFTVR
jgi:hypothetical protein